jgi:2-methylfumaryl-CoA isomerase
VNATAPLDGLTVLEVSSFVAAPLGGMTLAQLGAEVIRVDPVGGGADLGRWPLAPSGVSLYWTALNKGKRSVTLNFGTAEGRGLLSDLLAASGPGGGIVLTNAGRDWLSYAGLARVRPDLIHLQIQGYRDGRTAVDYGQRRDRVPVAHRSGEPGGTGEPRPAGLGCGLRPVRRGRAAGRRAAAGADRGG